MKQQEAALLAAFRRMGEKQQEFTIEFAHKLAAQQASKKPHLRLVNSKPIP
jgi:hypothetical protein